MKKFFFICLLITSSTSGFAQARIDPSVTGKEAGRSALLRLKPRVGDIFHYKMTSKTQVSIKNANDLFTEGGWRDIKPTDKAATLTTLYISVTVRAKRINEATDFQVRIDSIHYTLDNNGKITSYSSTNPKDRLEPDFIKYGILTGYDLGAIYDSTGLEKDIYAFYNIVDEAYANLPDSLQTDDEMRSLENQVSSALNTDFGNIFTTLPEEKAEKDSSFTSSFKEDYTVYSTLSFPMQKEYKQNVVRIEEQAGKTYAVINDTTTMTPVERVLDEKEYRTTLPTFTYAKNNTRSIDTENGMLIYSKQTEDRSYSLKIESKAAKDEGKSVVTVQRYKGEAVVELMK